MPRSPWLATSRRAWLASSVKRGTAREADLGLLRCVRVGARRQMGKVSAAVADGGQARCVGSPVASPSRG
eukprot:4778929-Alexandrium_andersonii.AAC.1